MGNTADLTSTIKSILASIFVVVIAGCGGSSSESGIEEQILDNIYEDAFRDNFRNLPGSWEGIAYEGVFSASATRIEEVAATFRMLENSWSDGSIVGEIIFAQCIPRLGVTVTSQNNVISIAGSDSGRSVELTIDPFMDGVNASRFRSSYTYTSNINDCPPRSSGNLSMDRL